MTDLRHIVSGPRAVRLGMFLGGHVPEGMGRRLSRWGAGLVCRLRPAVYRIVHANLQQVLGPGASREELEQKARQVFYYALRGYFDLFRALHLPVEQLAAQVDLPGETRLAARTLWNREGGAIVVFPHLSNFDLGGHAFLSLLPETQLFTLPDPSPGFQMINESRNREGVAITPLSSAALRQSIRLLRRGGVVAVAGDRPVSDLDEPVPFFGRPAPVPSGHVRLAVKTGAAVAIAYCILSPETNRYTMYLEPAMDLIRTGNQDEEVALNLRRILDALERVISRWAEQWLMFVPVWPELMQG